MNVYEFDILSVVLMYFLERVHRNFKNNRIITHTAISSNVINNFVCEQDIFDSKMYENSFIGDGQVGDEKDMSFRNFFSNIYNNINKDKSEKN